MGCCQGNFEQVQKDLACARAENEALRAENAKLRSQLQHGRSGAASPSAVRVEAPTVPSAAQAPAQMPQALGEVRQGQPSLPGLTGDHREASPAPQTLGSTEEQLLAAAPHATAQEPSSGFAGLKKGFLNKPNDTDAQAVDEMIQEAVKTSPASKSTAYSYAVAGREHAKEELGACMLCLEPLPNDPREVVNLCASEPRCLCLLHRSCFLNPQYEMSDNFRRCMICKKPADPAMVRLAVQARKKPLGSR
ncbi:unnamed protein product [Symbiodinium microadriaticum]|nr:unnamed protein product [Symbiodinium microadriaticum]CAE7488529.1 unnamed protein product [Symbiodinium sp. KB8]